MFTNLPAIQVSNLTFTYSGTNHPVLQQINLNIQPGEFLVLAGPSGCGKSTLARCLTGFIPHEYPGLLKGSVMVYGQNTRNHSIYTLARYINLVQQDPDGQLVTLNVTDELAFGLENFQFSIAEIQERIEQVLQVIQSQHLVNRDTHTLSGGEKQKIILAAFMGLQSPILILDEPTTRLDPPTAHQVIKTLVQLNRDFKITILVIEHHITQFLPHASRWLLMDRGQILFDGTLQQMQRTPDQLTKLGVYLAAPKIPSTSRPVVSGSPLISVHNLDFSYSSTNQSNQVLKDISFSIVPGELIALMGPNGSGKTTLLLHLIGLLQPNEGKIFLKNHLLADQKTSDLARSIGFAFQNPLHQLFERTVQDEILLASRHLGIPDKDTAQLRSLMLLEHFQLDKYQHRSPFTLSLGEQRRLTIASILLHQPQLLLLDEPFIGQDYQNIKQFMLHIQAFVKEGGSVILSTHDPQTVKMYCNRLLFLKEGRLLLDNPLPGAFTRLEELGEKQFTTRGFEHIKEGLC